MDGEANEALAPVVTIYQKANTPVQSSDLAVLLRLAELAFIRTVQLYVNQMMPVEQRLLLGRDLFEIGPAILAMKHDLKRSWTLRDICRETSVSKTRLVDTFTQTFGTAPMKYLAELRMKEASKLLRENALSIAQIAHRVGFKSDASFNRTFKRHFGVPPGMYRDVAPGRAV
jgi:transcriptional regulator GlxA family with amidase domain